MGEPELHSDEKILLTTQDVFVKSIPFEAILTNKRIILIDRKKNLIPQKDVLLATIRDIEAGENAIRDQFINLSLITNTGETRQLMLTFSRTAGGSRKRERDEWVKALKELTTSSIQKALRKVVPSFNDEPMKASPDQATSRFEVTGRPAGKKEIESAQPIKKIIESGAVPPKPVETTSLPAGSFCSRCGNRVPPESTFCNRCGSKVYPPGQEIPVTESAVPQVSVDSPMPAVKQPAAERRERPIDKEIQSIEPLIEGSVPRTTEAPPVQPSHAPEPIMETPAAEDASSVIAKAAQSIIEGTIPADAAASGTGIPAEAGGSTASQVKSIIPEVFLRKDLPHQPVPGAPQVPVPPPVRSSAPKSHMLTIAIVIILIIAVAGGAFYYWNYMRAPGPAEGEGTGITPTMTISLTPTATPVPTTVKAVETTQATPAQTQVLIPQTGVWVRVIYSGQFKGTVGTAADQSPVNDTGDKFYAIATSEGIVQASIQKRDGSGEELVVEVYKNGSLVKRQTTTVPKGVIDLQVNLKPPATTTVPTTKPTTPAANTTAVNTTATVTATTTTSA
ncbi:MAG: hypothetical protein A4E35_00064 [Methanoregula sp. PtaU1.Bin051]|nr:MAG: hypothetical protein A4E35_00064 [Methanoregula sp. PtaU1.Bin051]